MNGAAASAPFPILVLNGGSSSIKFAVYQASPQLTLNCEGEASGIGTPEALFSFRQATRESAPAASADLSSFPDAVRRIAAALDTPGVPKPRAIAHRVVHSGPKLKQHQRITSEVFRQIQEATPFAPLHQPLAVEIIQEAMHHFPGVENYACFDTAFHRTMPEAAYIYPLPAEIRDQGVRRYGFHGLSCESIVRQLSAAGLLVSRLVIAHLGSGASVTAVLNGKSIDNTMGLTPCGGILMGTRSGDLDPGLVFYLMRHHAAASGDPVDYVEEMLNRHSGLLALSGLSNDMRLLREAASRDDAGAIRAIQAFVRSIAKAIGASMAVLSGADAIVFTGGIGEHDAATRRELCEALRGFGLAIDDQANRSSGGALRKISSTSSSIAVYVVPAEEDLMMAEHTLHLARIPAGVDLRDRNAQGIF